MYRGLFARAEVCTIACGTWPCAHVASSSLPWRAAACRARQPAAIRRRRSSSLSGPSHVKSCFPALREATHRPCLKRSVPQGRLHDRPHTRPPDKRAQLRRRSKPDMPKRYISQEKQGTACTPSQRGLQRATSAACCSLPVNAVLWLLARARTPHGVRALQGPLRKGRKLARRASISMSLACLQPTLKYSSRHASAP